MLKIIFWLLLLNSACFAAAPIEISTAGTNIGIGTSSVANAFSINNSVAVGANYATTTAPVNSLIVQGNIGAGSVNPGQALDVQGTMRANYGLFGNSGTNWTAISTIGTGVNWPSNLGVYGGGLAAEMVNKGYELIIPQPSGLNVSGNGNEVQGFKNYHGNLYIGYFSNGSTLPSNSMSPVYKWDGNSVSFVYNLGTGSDFGGIKPIEEYKGNLYIGNQAGPTGANSGSVYAFNTGTISNFVQMNGIAGGARNSAVTIPNDSSNNAIFGSTSYSVEYYGRIDDLGASNAGQILRKYNASATSGFKMSVGAGNIISVSIRDSAVETTTTSTTFTLGNYHDIVFSWTSGSAPKIYIDGSEASYSVSTSITTPADDTSNTLYLGNNVSSNGLFGGTFRRLRIWRNYAVTSGDATTLASGGTISTAPTGEYLFSEGSGTTTADSSGHGNTGTIVSPAYWNNNLFDLSFSSGSDSAIYSMAVFKGKLYAGAGFAVSRIYSFDGTTWSMVYTGLSGSGLVTSLYVFEGKLFASLSGSAGNNSAILSSPDGSTWTVEATFPFATYTEINNLQEFKGKLFADVIKGASGSNDILKRENSTGTWGVVATLGNSSVENQAWGMSVYNNALYVGSTVTNATSKIYKSYDGNTFVQDLQLTGGGNGRESFAMYNYNGSLYIGLGYQNSTTADVWRKTDSLGQQEDWVHNFIDKFRGNTENGYNWPNDPSLISVSTPVKFDSIIRTVGGVNWIDLSGYSIGNVLTATTGGGANWTLPTSSSQWTTTNTTDVYLPNSGNIGIGTTLTTTSAMSIMSGNVGIGTWKPNRTLAVNSSSANVAVFTSNAAYAGGGGTGNLSVRSDDGAAMTGGLKFSTLEFASARDSSHTIGAANAITSYATEDWSGTNNGSRIDFETTNNGNSSAARNVRMTINNSNIGIGTFIPSARLAILGNMGIGQTAASAFLNTAPPLGGMIIQNNVGIGSVTPGQLLDVQGTFRGMGVINTTFGTTALTPSGNTTKLATSSGSLTSGDCVKLDASGNYIDAGSACGGSGSNPGGGQNAVQYNNSTNFTGTENVFSFNGTNVGIGTTNGIQLLDVRGTLSLTGFKMATGASNNYILTSDVSGNGSWQAASGGSQSPWSSSIDGAANKLTNVSNIGIGTTSLTSSLTIQKNGSTDYAHLNSSAGSGGDIFLIKNSGNIGIGSTVPGQMLDVQGTARAIGFTVGNAGITSSGSSTGNISYFSSNVGIASINPGQALDVQGTVRSLAFIKSSGTSSQFLKADGSTDSNTYSTATVNSGTANQAAYYSASSATISGNSNIIFNGSNVGIGSATPGQFLDVQGTTRVFNGMLDVGGYGTTPQVVTNIKGGFKSSNNAIDGIEMRNGSSGTSAEFRFNIVDDQNANYISFSMPSSGNSASLFGQTRSTIGAVFTNKLTGTGRVLAVGTVAANNLILGTNNVQRLTITSDGNVGIGSATPGQKFDVNGTVRIFGGTMSANQILCACSDGVRIGHCTAAATVVSSGNCTCADASGTC